MSQDKPAGKTPAREQDAPQSTERPSAPPAGDARGDAAKQQQNREHLGVDEDHETPDMKKGHRGTFP